MDEDGVVLVDFLQVDDELGRIMLGVGENLCTEESDDMIRDDLGGFAAEVSVVDAQLGVEPVDFVRDELSRDEALRTGFDQDRAWVRTGRGCRVPWMRPRPEPWPSVPLCL